MPERILRFILSRLIGTLVDTVILWTLSRLFFHSYVGDYIIAPAISFEFAMFNNYALSYFYIWHKRIPMKAARDFFIRLIPFNIAAIIGFLIKMFFILLFERIFGWDVVYCNLAALLFSGIFNFFLAEKIIFPKHAEILAQKDYSYTDENSDIEAKDNSSGSRDNSIKNNI